MPEETLDQARRWLAGARERLGRDPLPVLEIRAEYDQALRYLKARTRRHRFPGAASSRAVEAALKGLHYEKVMNSIVRGAVTSLDWTDGSLKPEPPSLP